MSSASSPLCTPEEYLAIEREALTKSEYHDGEIVRRAGDNAANSLLAVNLGNELHQRLKGRRCLVFNSDMKVWVERYRRFLYPDLSGLCGEPRYFDGIRDVLLNPTFVVEVLSPKTEAYDRGKKLALYMAQPAIVEIVLVSQDEIRVEKYTREADGIWRFQNFAGAGATIRFDSVDCAVPLRDFYDGVELPPAADPA